MGQKFSYKCDKCGYSVITSAGHDVGMLAVTDTYICNLCKKIVDVTVGVYGETFLNEEISLKKLNKKYDIEFYTCPECGSKTDLIEWDIRKKPCPKCDGKMRKDKEESEILWD